MQSRFIWTLLLSLAACGVQAQTSIGDSEQELRPRTVDAQHFGSAVAVFGRTALVGSPATSAVEVFEKSKRGQWKFHRRLTMPGGSQFGAHIAFDGVSALIAAPGAQAVYYYVMRDGELRRDGQLPGTFPGGTSVDDYDVALSGCDAAVSGLGSNSLYVVKTFDRCQGDHWVAVDTLRPDSALPESQFGRRIVLKNGQMVLGSPLSVLVDIGSVYCYARESGHWQFQQRIEAPDALDTNAFGRALAVQGDAMVVGDPEVDGLGAVYTYVRVDGTWTFDNKIVSLPEETPDDTYFRFGESLALSRGVLAIAAPGAGPAGVDLPGYVYLYQRAGNTSYSFTELLAGHAPSAQFGQAMAIRERTLVVGEPGGEGAAYAYRLPAAD